MKLIQTFSFGLESGPNLIREISRTLLTKCLKGTVDVIYSDPPLKDWHIRFTTVPLNTLYDQE